MFWSENKMNLDFFLNANTDVYGWIIESMLRFKSRLRILGKNNPKPNTF